MTSTSAHVQREDREAVTVHADLSDRDQLLVMAGELQTMSDLIEKYPAEAQLIMAALEDGLTLGPMQVTGMGVQDSRNSATGIERPSR
jgi:hypothetical protein